MGKGKLAKFADMAQMEHVFEFPIRYGESVECAMRGHWGEQVFHNSNPIILELGCGRGEYTVGLARRHPDTNFIGVDIKGSRMWTGARQAEQEGLKNVAFLRTNIEFIDHFFDEGEVSELWLTFSDPQMKKVTKRLTSTYFVERYRRFVRTDGLIHVKTDSNFLFTYTEEMLRANHVEPLVCTRDLYSTDKQEADKHDDVAMLDAARSIQTYYESMWMGRGIPIKYLAYELPHEGELVEPDVEIPLDEYRSYSREKRSSLATAR